ncbi:T9SS type A sorting domain-containing protein [Aurantibacillus circumpalustris]|uniref:T9SS type A sorting domain-containing protein n=1 Tax=Aurantibacillus circumpalustris TaxID=3036359 RepID=UPI00295AD8B9|nr:T9SS type A sorting domain-containing protein [Aurantibacillus circumpalustris]
MKLTPKKKSFLAINIKKIATTLFLFSYFSYSAQVTTQTYSYTGSVQTFTVPSCVFNLTLNVSGAKGGASAGSIPGGLGGSASGVLSVIPGDVIHIYVGSSTGYNGGGLAGFSTCTAALAGCGGGATDIRLNGISLTDRVIVGGGGGGASGNRIQFCGRGNGGGGGGGYYGGGGGSAWPGGTGWTMSTGGTQISGGLAGTSVYTISSPGSNGAPGTQGSGGNGGCEIASNQAGTAAGVPGGAGGGLFGAPGQYVGVGGGGNEATGNWTGMSGAGGSSYTGTLTNGTTVVGASSGDGIATIAYSTGPGTISTAASMCVGGSINLIASGQVSYTWSTGSFASSITIAPSLSASYTVIGTNLLGCNSTTVFNVSVDGSGPTIGISASANSVCPGNTVALTALGAASYTWSGGIQNGTPFPLFSSAIYTVSGSNSCGTATAATSLFISPAPVINITASTPSVCSGNSVMLTASGASSYTWTGNIANGSAFIPSVTNAYTVTGTSTLNCSGIAITTITVYNSPSIPPTLNQNTICLGSSAILTAFGATNYSWSPGNLNTASISVSPSITTIYTVTQSNASCAEIKTISLVVNPALVVAAIASNTSICANHVATLAAAGALTYTWLPGNLNGSNITVSPASSIIYTINASDGICSTSTLLALNVNPNPTLVISASPLTICPGDISTLTISGASSYTWVPGNLSGTNPTVSPNVTSLYSVTGENNFGCTSGTSEVIIVSQTPTITAGATKPLVCSGAPSTLTVTGANTYSWSVGSQNSTITVNPLVSTVYTVTGYSTLYNCPVSKTVAVSIFTPSFSVSGNTAVCQGGSVILSASGANSYTWAGASPSQNFTATPTVATMYVVSATSSSLSVNCVSSASVFVSIAPDPTVSASASKSIVCKGEPAILSGNGASTYLWTGLTGGSTIQVTPIGIQTVYSVTGTDVNGCTGTATVLVKVSNCAGLQKFERQLNGILIYPNPSAGIFTIHSDTEINLRIFDGLGRVIKEIYLSASNNFELRISDLSEAVYYIAGEKDNYQFRSKLVVNH